jgi:hypothetical protein
VGNLLVTDCDAVRIELFKLCYIKGEFVLNDKADAEECLTFILAQMHTWMQSASTKPDANRLKLLNGPAPEDVTRNLEELSKAIECIYSHNQRALI